METTEAVRYRSSCDRETALKRLAVYRERREHLHDDVQAAIAAGVIPAEVARVSGLTRQWVYRIVRTYPGNGEGHE